MSEKFEAWGVIELMGHQRVAGRISEQAIGGSNLLRVDIPLDAEDKFRTVYYGASAVYAMHVTTEAAARIVAKASVSRPAFAYEIEQSARLPAPAMRSNEMEFDDEPENF